MSTNTYEINNGNVPKTCCHYKEQANWVMVKKQPSINASSFGGIKVFLNLFTRDLPTMPIGKTYPLTALHARYTNIHQVQKAG